MSSFDPLPPIIHAGGKDDRMSLPPLPNYNDERVDMVAYSKAVPLWKRVYQHSLTQMMLLSVQAFCGPAMTDAIAGSYPTAFEPIFKS